MRPPRLHRRIILPEPRPHRPLKHVGEFDMLVSRVGAYLVGMDFIQSTPGAPAGKKMKLLLNVNGSIYVDKRGNRIVNEGERRDVIRDAVLGTPERYGYTVCDNTNFMSYDALKLPCLKTEDSL